MNRNLNARPKWAGFDTRAPEKWRQRKALLLVWVGIPLAIVAALGLFGYWTYTNYFAIWRNPVVKVNATTVDMDYFVKLLRIYSTTTGSSPSLAADQVLFQIEENELIRQGAAALQIQVTPDEVTQRIKGIFSPPPPETPTPAPAETPEATPDATPTLTPTPAQTGTPDPTATEGEGAPTPESTPTAVATPTTAPTPTPDFDTTYRDFLKRIKLSGQDYRGLVEVGLLREKVTDYLEEHNVPAEGPQVHLHAILAATSQNPDASQNPNDVIARLKNGEDFAAVAREVSLDPGAQANGGDFGWVPKGVYPYLDDVAFSIDVGVVSDPVETSQGIYVIMVTEKADSRPIDDKFIDSFVVKEFQNWLDEQRKAAKIQEYLDESKKAWAVDQVQGNEPQPAAG